MKKINKKKTKRKAEERVVEKTKELIEEVSKDEQVEGFSGGNFVDDSEKKEVNPYDAMFEDNPSEDESPMASIMNRGKDSSNKEINELDGWWSYRDDERKLTLYKCPKTHKKVIVYDKAV